MIYNSILETIGKTPIVRLNKLAPAGIDIFVKVEAFNPMSLNPVKPSWKQLPGIQGLHWRWCAQRRAIRL